MPPQQNHDPRRQKARDRSLILLMIGFALLMPPFARIFHLEGKLGGLPVTVVFLFAVWAALIAGAALLSRRLGDEGTKEIDGS